VIALTKQQENSDLIYSLNDRPAPWKAAYAAFQHLLASFVAIITPTLIIGGTLGLGAEIPYLLSMSLVVSGVGTFIQARRIGPVGAGLLCLQGTSFAFLGSILAAGFMVKNNGGGPDQVLATIFGVCGVAAFVEIILSFFITRIKRVITPVVTGVVITIIGLHLIKVGMTDLAGGFGADDFGSKENLAIGLITLTVIVALNMAQRAIIRLSAIILGMLVGYGVALYWGMVSFVDFSQVPLIAVPIPFKYGIAFDLSVFVPIAIIYLVTAIETSGDLTANSLVSREPTSGPVYLERIRGGVLGDGINSLIASVFNTFPNTTFSQNNGIIQLTGVASRYVAYYVAALFVLIGLFPMVGAVLQSLPKPVLGGATLVMFGTVTAAGVRVIAQADLNRNDLLLMAVAFGLAMGIESVPEVVNVLPDLPRSILGSPVTVGGLSAIFLSLILNRREPQVALEGNKVT